MNEFLHILIGVSVLVVSCFVYVVAFAAMSTLKVVNHKTQRGAAFFLVFLAMACFILASSGVVWCISRPFAPAPKVAIGAEARP